MTPEQIDLVQSSFEKVKPKLALVGMLFYKHLFEIAPQVRGLFSADMTKQSGLLMHTLAAAVSLLRSPTRLMPVLISLGNRHNGYGATEAHFDAVGQSLIKALEQGIGDDFTDKTRQAWVDLFGMVRDAMLKGMETPARTL